MSDSNMDTENNQSNASLEEEAIVKRVEHSVLTLLLKAAERQASKKQSPEESGNREGSPSSPVVIKSDSGEEETPGRVNRQHDPSIASDLANKLFGERKTAKQERKSRAAQDRTNAGVKKTRAKKDARRKSKELVYFYVIFEYGVAIKVCKGWPAASRHVVGHRGRYSQRFDTREAAEDAMNNADDSSDSSDDE